MLGRIDEMSKKTPLRLFAGSPRRAALSALAVALTLIVTVAVPPAPSTARAQAADPSATERSLNVDLVGYTDLGGRTDNAAVWGHRNVAYVGSSNPRRVGSSCQGKGVAVVDVADPARPVHIGALAERPGTSAEDVQVLTVFSRAFTGDLLATGLQRCGAEGVGGLSLWDVTDPHMPAELSLFETGDGPSGVHELSLMRRDQQTIALLAVPFSESLDASGGDDVRIVDLTDPRRPVQLAEWGISKALGINVRDGRGQDRLVYAHSVATSPDGQRAYVSYWDAGVVILDIADLRNPRYLGRTSYEGDDEGNAHSAALANGGRVLIQTDEDLSVRTDAIGVSGTQDDGQLIASFGAFRSRLPAEDLSAAAVYVGRACPARADRDGAALAVDSYLADPRGKIALADRGDCTFVEKAARVQEDGAVGLIIVNDQNEPLTPDGDVQAVRIPVATVAADVGARLIAALAESPAASVTFETGGTGYDDWGFVRIWDVSGAAEPVALATFATAHARTDREKGPPDGGWYTAHQPAVLGDRVYVSWYGDGVRILDIADPTRPREVGYFVTSADAAAAGTALAGARPIPGASPMPIAPPMPSSAPTLLPTPVPPERAPAQPPPAQGSVWGVYPRGDLIFVSDQHLGLFILRDRTR